MPIYEYECNLCNFHFEKKQRIHDEAVAACPKCEGKSRRIFNSVPVIFKGSGFYTTDSRKSSHTEKAEEKPPKEEKPKDK